ncbi:myozenin-1-like isoform X2 [Conger conger]|uniref:myozenin-1-like isoform X2 n=1 Tax=Conger conger TaxID=82655 RepID=UPI002A5ABD01|nr:myozenin-1-like isoform X2 [Conger conger]
MPLSGTPAPNKRKKSSKIIVDLSQITQDIEQDEADAEVAEFDLGTKIKAPKDLMLEELSLLKNRGSKMFKMRQQRVERFIYENNPELLTESMENLQNLAPSLGGQVNEDSAQEGQANGEQSPADGAIQNNGSALESETQGEDGSGKAAGENGEEGDGGATEKEKEVEVEEKEEKEEKKVEYVKTYISPWERAMKGDSELTATMKVEMPGPCVYTDPPSFKSFNRMAIPFGGFERASQLTTFQMPEIDLTPEEPEPPLVFHRDISSRPSFNRTPIGWICTGEHTDITIEQLDGIPFDGETDDL